MTDKKKKKTEQQEIEVTPPSEEQVQEQKELSPMEKLKAERDDIMGRLQRTAADYQNYQKRMARQMSDAVEYANNDIIKAMLPILDDMERALEAAPDDDPMRQGMQLVHDKALDILGKYGLSMIEATDKEFDPQLHSAILHQPSDDHPPHTVIQEVQKGYQLKGRTLRPSQVVVSKENQADEDQEQ